MVSEHRVIAECRARPVHKGLFYFGHTTRLEDEGWRYDRWHDCWRAPGEEIRKPSWSLPEADLRRREAALAAIVPSSAECRLKIMNEKNEVLHDGVRVSSRSEEHTTELQSLMRTSYAVFCMKETNHPCQKHKEE